MFDVGVGCCRAIDVHLWEFCHDIVVGAGFRICLQANVLFPVVFLKLFECVGKVVFGFVCCFVMLAVWWSRESWVQGGARQLGVGWLRCCSCSAL